MPDQALKKATALSSMADVVLVMGSSMLVSPSDSLPFSGQAIHGKRFKFVLVNLQKTPYDQSSHLRIFAKCDKVMQLLMQELEIPIPAFVDQKNSESPEFISAFTEFYKFRTAPDEEWFRGPMDPSVITLDGGSGGDSPLMCTEGLSTLNSKLPKRRLARLKQNWYDASCQDVALPKAQLGQLVDVLGGGRSKDPWAFVVKVKSGRQEVELGFVPTQVLNFL
eukprot:TRINITY_DN1404_c0_g1_i2.p1 TRINITY_DN1404_c0_g1~~TRINITY_DN1404_c0_g1_i2.p1  ORF type:complete len:222 (-),score=55.55 TRINITY_DN1404_c0_g1_i2:94-759(-)